MARILYVTTRASADGASRALAALVSALPSSHEAAVASLTTIEGSFARWAGDRVSLHALGARGRWHPAVGQRLARLCRSVRPDIVHTQLSRADWWGRVVGRRLGLPVVSTVQNVHSSMYPAEFGPAFARVGLLLDRLTLRWADRVVAVSGGVRDDLLGHGVPAGKLSVVSNGIDLRRCEGLPPRAQVRREWGVAQDELVVGTCALLKPQKDVASLVEAARLLGARGVRATVLVFGDGPERAGLERRVAATRHGPCRVRLMGWRDDAVQVLGGLDVFVLPSRWEGLPVALLEAMAVGVPAIGTRVTGIEDVLREGITGWLVEPGRPEQLAACLERVLGDAGGRARIAAVGRDDVRARFSSQEVARQHVALYEQTLAGPRAGRAG